MASDIANRSRAVKHGQDSDSHLHSAARNRYGPGVPTKSKNKPQWIDVGRRVGIALKASGLNQIQLADKIGMPQPDISKAINGGRGLNLSQLKLIADVLGIDDLNQFAPGGPEPVVRPRGGTGAAKQTSDPGGTMPVNLGAALDRHPDLDWPRIKRFIELGPKLHSADTVLTVDQWDSIITMVLADETDRRNR